MSVWVRSIAANVIWFSFLFLECFEIRFLAPGGQSDFCTAAEQARFSSSCMQLDRSESKSRAIGNAYKLFIGEVKSIDYPVKSRFCTNMKRMTEPRRTLPAAKKAKRHQIKPLRHKAKCVETLIYARLFISGCRRRCCSLSRRNICLFLWCLRASQNKKGRK